MIIAQMNIVILLKTKKNVLIIVVKIINISFDLKIIATNHVQKIPQFQLIANIFVMLQKKRFQKY